MGKCNCRQWGFVIDATQLSAVVREVLAKDEQLVLWREREHRLSRDAGLGMDREVGQRAWDVDADVKLRDWYPEHIGRKAEDPREDHGGSCATAGRCSERTKRGNSGGSRTEDR